MSSKCVISNSGILTEKSDILRFKGIMLRASTEKPESVEAGSVVMGDIKLEILQEMVGLTLAGKILDYNHDSVGQEHRQIILGYSRIIDKFA